MDAAVRAVDWQVLLTHWALCNTWNFCLESSWHICFFFITTFSNSRLPQNIDKSVVVLQRCLATACHHGVPTCPCLSKDWGEIIIDIWPLLTSLFAACTGANAAISYLVLRTLVLWNHFYMNGYWCCSGKDCSQHFTRLFKHQLIVMFVFFPNCSYCQPAEERREQPLATNAGLPPQFCRLTAALWPWNKIAPVGVHEECRAASHLLTPEKNNSTEVEIHLQSSANYIPFSSFCKPV